MTIIKKNYSCCSCDYETSNKYSYAKHLKTNLHLKRLEQGGKKTVFKCSDCPYKTELKSNYNRHIKKHEENNIVHKFKCVLCDMTFRDNFNKNVHLKTNYHIKRLSRKNQEDIDKLDRNELMKNDEWASAKAEIRKKNRICVQQINLKKNSCRSLNRKCVDSSNKQTKQKVLKKLTIEEATEIKDNCQDYDESILPTLYFNITDEYQIKDFQQSEKNLNKDNENYRNDLSDLVFDMAEEVLCSLDA